MKKNILVKVGEREEIRIRNVPAEYDEHGELIRGAYDESYTVLVPITETRNVEMTADEISEMSQWAIETPTTEERISEIETVLSSLLE